MFFCGFVATIVKFYLPTTENFARKINKTVLSIKLFDSFVTNCSLPIFHPFTTSVNIPYWQSLLHRFVQKLSLLFVYNWKTKYFVKKNVRSTISPSVSTNSFPSKVNNKNLLIFKDLYKQIFFLCKLEGSLSRKLLNQNYSQNLSFCLDFRLFKGAPTFRNMFNETVPQIFINHINYMLRTEFFVLRINYKVFLNGKWIVGGIEAMMRWASTKNADDSVVPETWLIYAILLTFFFFCLSHIKSTFSSVD